MNQLREVIVDAIINQNMEPKEFVRFDTYVDCLQMCHQGMYWHHTSFAEGRRPISGAPFWGQL